MKTLDQTLMDQRVQQLEAEVARLTAERDRALDRVAAMEGLQEQEPMVTKRKSGLILHAGWDPLPVGAKLYAAPMPPSVPEGWQIVPAEPTDQMILAARVHHEGDAYLPCSLYAAMLKAAPKPEDV